MLATRVITAVVLLAALAASLLAASPVYFQGLLLLFGVAALWEWFRLMGLSADRAVLLAVVVAGISIALFLYGGMNGLLALFGAAMIIWIVVVLPTLKGKVLPSGSVDTQTALFGAILIPAAILAANHVWTRLGAIGLVSLLAIVFIADIAAYFVGRSIGKRKLAPSISPGKTWEGAIGGGVAVLIYGIFCLAVSAPWVQQTFPAVLAKQWGIVLTLVVLVALSSLSVVGDLFESMLKRRAGVKDSSHVLPGHGGVLDRIDAQLPVLPLAALLIWSVR
ncbi:MAG: phosphatidate cytidylyltransferase [Burkholderiaceae bacterium]